MFIFDLYDCKQLNLIICDSICDDMKATHLRVQLDPQLSARINRLRNERDINVSAWVRRLIRNALDYELPPEDLATAPATAAPLPGWKPVRLPDDSWGARFQGDIRTLPEDLEGLTIAVRTRSGDSWNATVTEVVERSPDRVLVRDHKLDR